jgi:predicted nucleotidyltransferase
MPVRSLNSSVLVWPDRDAVRRALEAWFAAERPKHPDLERFGYFGSYARGDWGVGSDLDLIAIVRTAAEPFERRAVAWDTPGLPVPAELLVYTVSEWDTLQKEAGRFARALRADTVWIYP